MIWLIGIGGSLGAAARFFLGRLITERAKGVHPFPIGTWVINVIGSFLLGIFMNLHLTAQTSEWVWFFFGIGFCGAFTTYSTFGYETMKPLKETQKINMRIFTNI